MAADNWTGEASESSCSDGRAGLVRLLEQQTSELDAITSKIQLWKNYETDYTELKQLLNEMQDKVRHSHKIPIAGTQLAFVKGHIIHTNEILVLLGDNLFALRSTKQANAIIDRRLANLREELKKSVEAKRKAEDWLKAVQQHKEDTEQYVEIIETM